MIPIPAFTRRDHGCCVHCHELARQLQEQHAYTERLARTLSAGNTLALVWAAWREYHRANKNAELAWTQRQAALAAEGVPEKKLTPEQTATVLEMTPRGAA